MPVIHSGVMADDGNDDVGSLERCAPPTNPERLELLRFLSKTNQEIFTCRFQFCFDSRLSKSSHVYCDECWMDKNLMNCLEHGSVLEDQNGSLKTRNFASIEV